MRSGGRNAFGVSLIKEKVPLLCPFLLSASGASAKMPAPLTRQTLTPNSSLLTPNSSQEVSPL